MYTLKVGDREFKLVKENNSFYLDKEPIDCGVASLGNSVYSVLKDGRSHNVVVLDIDAKNKEVKLEINNRQYSVIVKDDMDMLIEEMGFAAEGESKGNDVKAPMPGLILDVMVKGGDHVQKGDSLLILEAMKMENAIKSPVDGVVSAVLVAKGDSVEKNHTMIVL